MASLSVVRLTPSSSDNSFSFGSLSPALNLFSIVIMDNIESATSSDNRFSLVISSTPICNFPDHIISKTCIKINYCWTSDIYIPTYHINPVNHNNPVYTTLLFIHSVNSTMPFDMFPKP